MRIFTLTADQFYSYWASLGLGRKPYPLDVPPAERHAKPDENVASLLRLLGDHVTAVDVVADIGGPLRGLAASDGRRGVLAVLRDNRIVLSAIRSTGLASALVNVLPQAQPGSGKALSAPLDLVRGVGEQSHGGLWSSAHSVQAALIRAGLSRDDASLINELATGRKAGGQFGVTHLNERAPTVVTWFDTVKGRYLVVSDCKWLSIAPADNSRIASRIDSILTAA